MRIRDIVVSRDICVVHGVCLLSNVYYIVCVDNKLEWQIEVTAYGGLAGTIKERCECLIQRKQRSECWPNISKHYSIMISKLTRNYYCKWSTKLFVSLMVLCLEMLEILKITTLAIHYWEICFENPHLVQVTLKCTCFKSC